MILSFINIRKAPREVLLLCGALNYTIQSFQKYTKFHGKDFSNYVLSTVHISCSYVLIISIFLCSIYVYIYVLIPEHEIKVDISNRVLREKVQQLDWWIYTSFIGKLPWGQGRGGKGSIE